MSRELEELDDRVNTLEQQVGGHESDGMRSDIQLVGEALGIIRRVLADLVDAADVDAEALDRVVERVIDAAMDKLVERGAERQR